MTDCTPSTGSQILTLTGHKGNVTGVGYQKDAKWMYSCSEDGTVKVWDLRAPGSTRDYESRGPVNTVALHPNQAELVSGDRLGNIRVWDLAANRCSNELVPDGATSVQSVSLSADAKLMVAANNHGNCFFWHPRSSDEHTALSKLEAHRVRRACVL